MTLGFIHDGIESFSSPPVPVLRQAESLLQCDNTQAPDIDCICISSGLEEVCSRLCFELGPLLEPDLEVTDDSPFGASIPNTSGA